MDIKDFERELKLLDNKLSINTHPINTDVAGINWGSVYICAVPSKDIFDEKKEGYRDAVGNVHRTRPEALAKVKRFLWQLQNEKGFLELMTEPL